MNSRHPEKTTTIVGDSRVILPQLLFRDHKFDLIYIDGSHESADVLSDSLFSYNLLKPGGVLIFDDYEWWWQQQQPVKAGIHKFESIVKGMKVVHAGWQKIFVKDT